MRKASAGISPEGLPILTLLALGSLCFAILNWAIACVVALGFFFFSLHFFRDPERVVPQAPGLAISPADGKIIRIERLACPISGVEQQCVSIFMNVFSVHVNRSPVAGCLKEIRYYPGEFFNAAWDKASTDNERCAYQMEDAEGKTWEMVQIAGLIARRIVCRADEGDVLTRGERYGMIRFGSRVDLYVPEGYDVCVNIGEQVFAGQSIVAKKQIISS